MKSRTSGYTAANCVRQRCQNDLVGNSDFKNVLGLPDLAMRQLSSKKIYVKSHKDPINCSFSSAPWKIFV